jgi:hypothetical protein
VERRSNSCAKRGREARGLSNGRNNSPVRREVFY